MIFNSSAFVLFAFIFFSIYVFLVGQWRLYFLLLGSYVFYGWWDWRYLGLIFLTTGVDYWAGLKIAAAEGEPVLRKQYLWISLGLNLLVLFVFKYFNFFNASFTTLMHYLGIGFKPWVLNVVLPVGVSFYTFQSMAYTIDVYRRKIPAERNLVNFAAYVAFFPQLVAGPIERAGHLLPQLKILSDPTKRQIKEGFGLIIWGYFLKMCIADNVARVVNIYFDYGRNQSEAALMIANAPNHFFLDDPKFDSVLQTMNLHLTSPEIMMCLLAFGLQIYGDFAGYSNIARGVAKLFGVELMVNFRQPYLARNPSDFWQRWHISLSSWFREYLYFPMGGSRGVFLQTARNILVVMLLAGLWHGAAWNFVLWGLYWGLLSVGYHGIRRWFPSGGEHMFFRFRAVLIMFPLILFGWLMFRSSSFSQLKYFVVKLFTNCHWPPPQVSPIFQINLFWVVAFAVLVFSIDIYLEKSKKECILTFRRVWEYPLAALLVWLIVVYGGQSEQFIYFRF